MNQNNSTTKKQEKDLVFFVRVQYRCNSSWQGTIQWMDGKETQVFRSVLELGNLINTAKKNCTGEGTAKSGLKWEEKEDVS